MAREARNRVHMCQIRPLIKHSWNQGNMEVVPILDQQCSARCAAVVTRHDIAY